MKLLSPLRRTIFVSLLACAAFAAPASGLISSDAAGVLRPSGDRGRQLATLQSYLFTNPVTVGLDPAADGDRSTIQRGIQVWQDAIADCPFVLAKPGEKPMVVVRFVGRINSGGDVQGQVEATRRLHWGSSVSYRLEGTLLIRRTSGDRELTDDEKTEVMAHELGHLLGLDDAEGCVGLMGPFVPGHPRMRPSREEIDAVVNYRVQLRESIARLGK